MTACTYLRQKLMLWLCVLMLCFPCLLLFCYAVAFSVLLLCPVFCCCVLCLDFGGKYILISRQICRNRVADRCLTWYDSTLCHKPDLGMNFGISVSIHVTKSTLFSTCKISRHVDIISKPHHPDILPPTVHTSVTSRGTSQRFQSLCFIATRPSRSYTN